MRLSDEALQSLRRVLAELGFAKELEAASPADLEEFAAFILNLTASAVKTRERMRLLGRELPASAFPEAEEPPAQPTLPGFGA
jgi:hypothetical protein